MGSFTLSGYRTLISSTCKSPCLIKHRNFNFTSHVGMLATTIQPTPLRMLLIGAPGSGKGTQSTRVHRDFGLEAISSGDLLRRHINDGTSVGKIAKETIRRGMLLPDNIMLNILQFELEPRKTKSWLLDGFPRNLSQAQALDNQLISSQDTELNLVIHLDVPEDVILSRITDRWVHVPSGRVYNLGYNPPKTLGIDDITGEPLCQRDDDNPDVFKQRLSQFRELTMPLLEYYASKNVLVSIAGSTSDNIYPRIHKEIARRMFRPLSSNKCTARFI